MRRSMLLAILLALSLAPASALSYSYVNGVVSSSMPIPFYGGYLAGPGDGQLVVYSVHSDSSPTGSWWIVEYENGSIDRYPLGAPRPGPPAVSGGYVAVPAVKWYREEWYVSEINQQAYFGKHYIIDAGVLIVSAEGARWSELSWRMESFQPVGLQTVAISVGAPEHLYTLGDSFAVVFVDGSIVRAYVVGVNGSIIGSYTFNFSGTPFSDAFLISKDGSILLWKDNPAVIFANGTVREIDYRIPSQPVTAYGTGDAVIIGDLVFTSSGRVSSYEDYVSRLLPGELHVDSATSCGENLLIVTTHWTVFMAGSSGGGARVLAPYYSWGTRWGDPLAATVAGRWVALLPIVPGLDASMCVAGVPVAKYTVGVPGEGNILVPVAPRPDRPAEPPRLEEGNLSLIADTALDLGGRPVLGWPGGGLIVVANDSRTLAIHYNGTTAWAAGRGGVPLTVALGFVYLLGQEKLSSPPPWRIILLNASDGSQVLEASIDAGAPRASLVNAFVRLDGTVDLVWRTPGSYSLYETVVRGGRLDTSPGEAVGLTYGVEAGRILVMRHGRMWTADPGGPLGSPIGEPMPYEGLVWISGSTLVPVTSYHGLYGKLVPIVVVEGGEWYLVLPPTSLDSWSMRPGEAGGETGVVAVALEGLNYRVAAYWYTPADRTLHWRSTLLEADRVLSFSMGDGVLAVLYEKGGEIRLAVFEVTPHE